MKWKSKIMKLKNQLIAIGLIGGIAMSFDKAFAFTVSEEGGYVNHPSDRGGETKYGISKRQYPNLNIKDLTIDDAKDIYRTDYWLKSKADLLPAQLAVVHFDTAVNMGVPRAVRFLQQTAGTSPDGLFGPKTLAKVQEVIAVKGALAVALEYLQIRKAFYFTIIERDDTQKVFLRGWLGRIKNLKHEILSLK